MGEVDGSRRGGGEASRNAVPDARLALAPAAADTACCCDTPESSPLIHTQNAFSNFGKGAIHESPTPRGAM
jgi:hypothetical protein